MNREWRGSLVVIVALALAVRIIPILFGSESNDIRLYRLQGQPVLDGENIYRATHKVFPYAPLSMFFPALSLVIADATHVPFHAVIKFPAVLFDSGIVVLLYFALARKAGPAAARAGALLYALNPISILISSFHGNIMSFPTLLSLAAYEAFDRDGAKNGRLSALLLGVAIAWRSYPVLLLPLFLLKMRGGRAAKASYLTFAAAPTVLSALPFLFVGWRDMLREVLTYSGWTDFGPLAVVRAVLSFQAGRLYYALPGGGWDLVVSASKWVFIGAFLLLLARLATVGLLRAILITFVMFYSIYAGVGAQYFVWVIPFAVLARDRSLTLFLASGTCALIAFYLVYHPAILLGRFPLPALPFKALILGEAASLAAFWAASGLWLFRLLPREDR